MVGLPAMAGKVEALLVWLTTSHRMRRCEHIVQQRRQPHPAKFWAWRPPSSVICRSDTAALPKVSTGLPTNSIELERLRGTYRSPRAASGMLTFFADAAKSTFDCETARLRHPDGRNRLAEIITFVPGVIDPTSKAERQKRNECL